MRAHGFVKFGHFFANGKRGKVKKTKEHATKKKKKRRNKMKKMMMKRRKGGRGRRSRAV